MFSIFHAFRLFGNCGVKVHPLRLVDTISVLFKVPVRMSNISTEATCLKLICTKFAYSVKKMPIRRRLQYDTIRIIGPTIRYTIFTCAQKLTNRARQLYKNISMLFLLPLTRDLLFTNIYWINIMDLVVQLLLLWPPYVIGGHYIFALWFLYIYLSSIFLFFLA